MEKSVYINYPPRSDRQDDDGNLTHVEKEIFYRLVAISGIVELSNWIFTGRRWLTCRVYEAIKNLSCPIVELVWHRDSSFESISQSCLEGRKFLPNPTDLIPTTTFRGLALLAA